jgi:CHAT domain-containing protein
VRSNESPTSSRPAVALEATAGAVAACEISGGGAQVFELSPGARQFLRLSIQKGDLNLSATLYDAGGVKLFEYVSRRYETPEPLVVSESAGVYRLEVRSLEQEARGRRLELKVEEARPASARDLGRGAAWAAQAEASRLRASWEADALRKAVGKYAEARSSWSAAGDRASATATLQNMAEVQGARGEYRLALGLYRRVAAESRRYGDRRRELRASGRAARLDSALGHTGRAQGAFRRLLDYYERSGDAASPEDKRAYAETLNDAGEFYYLKGDLLKASKYFKASLGLFREVGDRAGEARSLLLNGYVSSSTGGQEEAAARFNEALGLARATGDRAGEALALAAMGVVHSLRGEGQAALDLQLEVARIFHVIGDRLSEALALNGVGQAYDDLNEKQIALDKYGQALKLFQAGGNLDRATVAVYQIGKVYASLGDSGQALTYFQRCVGLSRAAGRSRMEAYALNEVAAVYAARGAREKALDQYGRILRFHRAGGDLRGETMTLNKVGDFYLSLGEKRKSLDYYRRALSVSRDSGDRELELSTLYSVASAERDCDDLSGAVSHVEQSIKTIEELRTNIAGADLRSSYFAAVHKHYRLYIDLLMRLERLQPGGGFAAAALQASETARARSLLEILGEARADLRGDAAPHLLERERELQQLLRTQALYRMELSASTRTQAEAAEAESELRRLTAEYKALQAQLREQTPRYKTLTQPRPLTLAEMQAELRGGDTILLEYALGDERSFLWAVTNDSLASYELPARPVLEEAARAVHKSITARQPVEGESGAEYQARVAAADSAFREQAQALSNMLLGPVAGLLGDKRLVIVSEGMLQYIPFDALPAPAPPGRAPSNPGDESTPLVSRHETVSLPSLSTLAEIRREGPRAAPAEGLVAVLADPVFTNNDDRVRGSEATVAAAPQGAQAEPVVRALREFDRQTGKRGLLRLAHSSDEAAAILASAPAGTSMAAKDFAANRDTATSQLLGRYRIVHFATHGIINGEHPELSGIVLSMVTRDGAREDGFLQLHDIYNLKLSADLVVLSACETGLGKDVRGEGLVGLTRGFMYAGAKSVVASLWKVDDRATAEFMGHFYKALLRDGMPPSAALRSAKESIRQQRQWRAPYFWGGFVLQGEYRERIQVNEQSAVSAWAVVMPASVLAVAVSLIFLARRRAARLRHRVGAGAFRRRCIQRVGVGRIRSGGEAASHDEGTV